MATLSEYVQDNNGSIENEELRGFLKDLLELVKKVSLLIKKIYQKKILLKKTNQIRSCFKVQTLLSIVRKYNTIQHTVIMWFYNSKAISRNTLL